jgi:hypothetical protein
MFGRVISRMPVAQQEGSLVTSIRLRSHLIAVSRSLSRRPPSTPCSKTRHGQIGTSMHITNWVCPGVWSSIPSRAPGCTSQPRAPVRKDSTMDVVGLMCMHFCHQDQKFLPTRASVGIPGALVTTVPAPGAHFGADSGLPASGGGTQYRLSRAPPKAGPGGSWVVPHPRGQGGQHRSQNDSPEPCVIVIQAPVNPRPQLKLMRWFSFDEVSEFWVSDYFTTRMILEYASSKECGDESDRAGHADSRPDKTTDRQELNLLRAEAGNTLDFTVRLSVKASGPHTDAALH